MHGVKKGKGNGSIAQGNPLSLYSVVEWGRNYPRNPGRMRQQSRSDGIK